jgi:hypothetical protein
MSNYTDDSVTDVMIKTRWKEDPVCRRVEIKIQSSIPIAQQQGVDAWIETARPELPYFFEEAKSEFYLSEDGRRMLIVFEDQEMETYG